MFPTDSEFLLIDGKNDHSLNSTVYVELQPLPLGWGQTWPWSTGVSPRYHIVRTVISLFLDSGMEFNNTRELLDLYAAKDLMVAAHLEQMFESSFSNFRSQFLEPIDAAIQKLRAILDNNKLPDTPVQVKAPVALGMPSPKKLDIKTHLKRRLSGRLDCRPFPGNPEDWYQEMQELIDTRTQQEGDEREDEVRCSTSAEWLERKQDDLQLVIIDRDGWRSLPDPEFYWQNVPITSQEFHRRLSLSTVSFSAQMLGDIDDSQNTTDTDTSMTSSE